MSIINKEIQVVQKTKKKQNSKAQKFPFRELIRRNLYAIESRNNMTMTKKIFRLNSYISFSLALKETEKEKKRVSYRSFRFKINNYEQNKEEGTKKKNQGMSDET